MLYRLKDAGFSAYLVGGCVRDLLLGLNPKDFDVVTNAHPEQIKPLFSRCLLIGRRFRLAHVYFGRNMIEVATFRGGHQKTNNQRSQHGMILRDNAYGTIEEDIWRRDFTINALYYNIADFSVVDYCGGMQDLQDKILRMIGDPEVRYQEDPVRLLRIIRFAGKTGFNIEPKTERPILQHASLLQHVPAARLFDEILKIFHGGKALATLPLLEKYHLLSQLFPQLAQCLTLPAARKMLELTCQTTDARINSDKHVSPAFLFAAFLWYPLLQRIEHLKEQGLEPGILQSKASQEIISAQTKRIAIPRRFTLAVREIWDLQHRLEQRKPSAIFYLLEHPRFRAAYDFLLLRAECGEATHEAGKWWTAFQEADDTYRQHMMKALPKIKKHTKRRKKKPTV